VDDLSMVPPHNLSTERSLLCSILIDPDQYYIVAPIIRQPESFYKTFHQQVYRAIEKVVDSGEPLDTFSVSKELYKQTKEDHSTKINEIATYYPTGAIAERFAKEVAEHSARRMAIHSTANAMTKLFDKGTDLQAVLIGVQGELDQIDISSSRKEPVEAISVVEKIIDNYRAGTTVKGIPTGLRALDNLWAGLYPQELTVLAGRPSMGKTQLALYLSKQTAVYTGEPVLFFSLEMSEDQLGLRILATELEVDVDMLRREQVSQERIESRQGLALAEIAKARIYINDEPDLTTLEMHNIAAKMKREKGLSLVVCDYLTLIEDDKEGGDTYALQVTKTTRRMAAIAKKLNIPVLLLAQLNRDVEKRPNKRPVLNDLKESGGIEERADNVMLLFRKSYYEKDCKDNTLEIIVAKQKQGPRGVTAYVLYQPDTGRFMDKTRREEPEEQKALGGAYQ
jgi:replicative DNA helicase